MVYSPPRSRNELLDRYAAGERYFAGAELDQNMVPQGIVDLTGAVLDGADFSNCWFSASFSGASLRAVNFTHANVKCCDFSRADLTDAIFFGAAIEAATWAGAKVLRTKFGDVSLYGAILTEAEFTAIIESEL
jgi:uncharacterized protein YjbI with pentapeptide repeats